MTSKQQRLLQSHRVLVSHLSSPSSRTMATHLALKKLCVPHSTLSGSALAESELRLRLRPLGSWDTSGSGRRPPLELRLRPPGVWLTWGSSSGRAELRLTRPVRNVPPAVRPRAASDGCSRPINCGCQTEAGGQTSC